MIQLNNLECGYGKKRILSNVTGFIKQGEITCLLGKNGVGKTTLFKTILGLIPPLSGTITVKNKNITEYSHQELAKEISYVPQAHGTPFPFSVFDVVLMGNIAHTKGLFHHPTIESQHIAASCIALLGIKHLSHKTFSKLSGGEKQMVLIARAMAQQPKFIAMDEPTSNLDMGNNIKVMKITQMLKEKGYGVIINTHSPEQALNYADHVIMLKEGKIATSGNPNVVIDTQSISDIYNAEIELIETKTIKGNTRKVCVTI
jgi:iron complex transport system ATP-binding protein